MSIFLSPYMFIITGCLFIIICGIEGIYSFHKNIGTSSYLHLFDIDLPFIILLAIWPMVIPFNKGIYNLATFCSGVTGLVTCSVLGVYVGFKLLYAIVHKNKNLG